MNSPALLSSSLSGVATAAGPGNAPQRLLYSGAPSSGALLAYDDDTQPMQGRLRLNPASPADAGTIGGAPHSLATASGVLRSADAPCKAPSREGGECCPAPISAFVNEWVGPARNGNSRFAPRDFTFKAVIGEPEW